MNATNYQVSRRRLAQHLGDVQDDLRTAVESLRQPGVNVAEIAAELVTLVGRLNAIAGMATEPADD